MCSTVTGISDLWLCIRYVRVMTIVITFPSEGVIYDLGTIYAF
jgi:hypothetical protein